MSDETLMTPPTAAFTASAHIDRAAYDEMYARSVSDPVGFWGEMGKTLDWMTPYTQVKKTTFDFGRVDIQWYGDGVLNVSANCIDRHLPNARCKPRSFSSPMTPTPPPSTSPTKSSPTR